MPIMGGAIIGIVIFALAKIARVGAGYSLFRRQTILGSGLLVSKYHVSLFDAFA
jgi:hypothetical protein